MTNNDGQCQSPMLISQTKFLGTQIHLMCPEKCLKCLMIGAQYAQSPGKVFNIFNKLTNLIPNDNSNLLVWRAG